ncbi:MAG TPA: hypothetical protein VFO34_15865 [Candidatus Acidoferrales bacterium]|nr:hypothetical protein [Candidatus Acidoferrales bacterium]
MKVKEPIGRKIFALVSLVDKLPPASKLKNTSAVMRKSIELRRKPHAISFSRFPLEQVSNPA